MATRATAMQCMAVVTAKRLGGPRVGRRRWWRRRKSGRGGGGGGIAGLVEEEGPPPPGLVPDPTTVERCDALRPPSRSLAQRKAKVTCGRTRVKR
eukprot:5641490-Prymnesium_polylepis.1